MVAERGEFFGDAANSDRALGVERAGERAVIEEADAQLGWSSAQFLDMGTSGAWCNHAVADAGAMRRVK